MPAEVRTSWIHSSATLYSQQQLEMRSQAMTSPQTQALHPALVETASYGLRAIDYFLSVWLALPAALKGETQAWINFLARHSNKQRTFDVLSEEIADITDCLAC